MSIFNILKSDSFASTLDALSGKAREVADSVGRNLPGSVQEFGDKARDAVGAVSDNLPKNAGTILGVGSLVALVGAMMPKSVVKTAALVGAGAIAMNFYRKWSASKKEEAQEQTQALPAADDPAAMLMLRAIVYAARADGHIDEQEKARIDKLTRQFLSGQDSMNQVARLMDEAIDPGLLAAQIRSQEQGEDLYRLSCLVLDIDHFMERAYLDALAGALHIDKAGQSALEKEAEEAKAQLDAM